ncbi:MAG TPA: MDR family MFS transporter [Streptosporangiaceae bacterium]|nr:MDR family MFS transporter [Streptosporangiaceae bacterium]
MSDNPAVAAPAGGTTFATRREFMIVLPGLLLTLIIAMLDQLVVSTALPRIVGDLGGLNHLAWVVTAYVLASTITTPLYGKLGDLYGRKRLLMIAIIIFLVGSALSGLSHNMDQLIAFRALQGLGAGGLMVGAIATIGDMVAPRERGQYMGYMMAAMMVAMIAGPLVGGYITDSLSWRWIFYINMPIGGAALVYLWATMHVPRRRVEHKVDYLGAAVIAIGATAIVLLTTWGGTQYAWGSWEIIMLAAITAAAIVAFFFVEGRAVEPVLPLHVFKNRNFSLASSMSFLLGFVMLGALTFLPLYQQTVQHASPTTSGLMLIPLMLGSTVTTLVAGQVTTRTGRYKILPIIGGVVMTVAIYLLTHLGPHTTRLNSALYFVVLGVGMGFLMQITSLIVQNSVEQKDMGVASSSRAFFQQIGGSMGVSLFGVIFIHRLTSAMASKLPGAHLRAGGGTLNPATINSLPPVIKQAAFFAISKGLDYVFWYTVPASVLVFLLALWVKEIPLRSRDDTPAQQAAASPEQLETADLGAI